MASQKTKKSTSGGRLGFLVSKSTGASSLLSASDIRADNLAAAAKETAEMRAKDEEDEAKRKARSSIPEELAYTTLGRMHGQRKKPPSEAEEKEEAEQKQRKRRSQPCNDEVQVRFTHTVDGASGQVHLVFPDKVAPVIAKHAPWIDRLATEVLHRKKRVEALQVFLLPRESLVIYVKDFVPKEQSEAIVQELNKEAKFNAPIIFGHPTPRLICWQTTGDAWDIDYAFSGQVQQATTMTPEVKRAMLQLESIFGTGLNSSLINCYRREKIYDANGKWVRGAGKESISFHHDNEELYDLFPLILSLSLDQRRRFDIICEKSDGRPFVSFKLGGGDFCAMAGATNMNCVHGCPKETSLNVTKNRVSLTYRTVVRRIALQNAHERHKRRNAPAFSANGVSAATAIATAAVASEPDKMGDFMDM